VGAYFIVHWYAYSTYYLGNDAGTVAVYQGQPGGVLWFKPLKVYDTGYLVSTLPPLTRSNLNQTIPESTLGGAQQVADQFCAASPSCVASTTPSTTTTSTTTTTVKG